MNLKSSLVLLMATCVMTVPVAAKNDKQHNRQLPPGLQKKAASGQPLPPGWQKKLQPGKVMDTQVFQQSRIVVPVDDKGLLTVSIEGKLVRLYQNTREIVEILD